MMNKENNNAQAQVYVGGYIAPGVNVVKVKTVSVMCTSESLYGGFTNGEQEGN